MFNLIKKKLINLLFGIVSIVILLFGVENNLLDEVLFWIVDGILIGLTFVYKKNDAEKKEFILLSRCKKLIILLLMATCIIFEILVITSTGWDGLGYVLLMMLNLIILASIIIINSIIRIYYRLKYNQTFKFKMFLKENIVFLIIFSSLSIALISIYFKIA